MQIFKKTAIMILILSIVSLNLPNTMFAQQNIKVAKNHITQNSPMVLTTPEVDIPLGKPEKRISNWVWLGLCAVAIGGVAAAVGSSSDSDSGGGSGTEIPAANTGEITVTW